MDIVSKVQHNRNILAHVRKTHYMDGRKRAVTEEWRARVMAELKRRGKTQQWLEQKIGAGQGSLTATLKRQGMEFSVHVEPICRVLDIGLPIDLDEAEVQWVSLMRDSAPEMRGAVLATLKAAKKS